MNQARQALAKLAEQLPSKDDLRRAENTGDAQLPASLPNHAQSREARELAQAQRELREAVQKLADLHHQPPASLARGPIEELAREQAKLAQDAGKLAKQAARERGKQATGSQQAERAAHAAGKAAEELQAGALEPARRAGKASAQQLGQLARNLQDAATKPESAARGEARTAAELARRQQAVNDRLQALGRHPDAEAAQQAERQGQLESQSEKLNQDLQHLAEQMRYAPPAQQSAYRAADLGRQGHDAMHRARDADMRGDQPQEHQEQQQAAERLDQAAAQAEQASAHLAAALAARSRQSGDPQPSQATGRNVQQAEEAMSQAQKELAQNQQQAAQAEMERAASALQQVVQQLARQSGPPRQGGRQPQRGPVVGGGLVDTSLLGPGGLKYAGKRWGELPGELRTRIIQDMQARYGEDYARIIKLYFEELADTRKPPAANQR